MKQGRNDQCSCGSGQKYKKCCLLKSRHEGETIKSKVPLISQSFFERYNCTDLLQAIAALSILPENHGKNYRFEQITEEAIRNFNSKEEIASMSDLQTFLDQEYPSNYMEDEPFNPLTDLITFHGGDYLIFPGISDGTSFILNNILKAVYHYANNALPKEFMNNVYEATVLILEISNHIAELAGYNRYQIGTVDKGLINFPTDGTFNLLKGAVSISRTEMHRLLNAFGIKTEILNIFLLEVNSPELIENYGQESLVITKPIINAQGKFVVHSPCNLSFALTEFIRAEAQRLNCYPMLNEIYHSFLWYDLQIKLKKIGFKYLPINTSLLKISQKSTYGIYQFDDNKLAYIYLKYPERHTDQETDGRNALQQVLNLPEYQGFEILEMPMVSSLGDTFLAGADKSKFGQTLLLQVSEIAIIFELKNVDAIDLYKFAIAYEKVHDSFMGFSSFIDKFKYYRENDNSFYNSDEAGKIKLVIEPGYGFELFLESKFTSDRHAVPMNENGKTVLIEVIKKDNYAPIYLNLEELAQGHLNFLVESFAQPLWVTPLNIPDNASPTLRKMYWEMCDAIAYWLWQISDGIKSKLSTIGKGPIKINFDFSDVSKFDVLERNFDRDQDLENKFQFSTTDTTITITIPYEILPYFYGADNEGERQLVKAILNGINALLLSNTQTGFTDQEISKIIATSAPLGMKKKIFILDTSDNFLLDPLNLSGYRLVQSYDVGVVLDNIVPLMGRNAPPIGKLATKKEKENLTSAIVHKTLLPLLKSKLALYDTTELLKKLLSINEGLINKRESVRIYTPTRIACFVSVEEHQRDLIKELGELDKATVTVRCLIEHIAAEPYQGIVPVSRMAIDELMAIMEQILAWGSMGDQLHFSLVDIELGILPSNRIGSEKTVIREIFDPFKSAKTTENITDAIKSFEQVFPQRLSVEKGKPVPAALEKAFLLDYNLTFSRVCEFIEGLVHIGFLQSTAYSSMALNLLNEEVNKYVREFKRDEFESVIQYLSLFQRGNVETLPAGGYEFIDITPWRYNRMLSLIRKPLVIVEERNQKIVYWGSRQLLQSRITLVDQLLSGRFRAFKGSEVVKVLGKFANQRGDDLVKAVVAAINPNNLIIDTDAYIRQGSALNHTHDIGDVDVLIIDSSDQILYSLECKSMSPSRNVKEMIEEVTKLFGENSSEKAWVEKHMIRHQWLEENLEAVGRVYKVDLTGYTVKSFFVTNEEMLTPHLRKQSLPLPFITLYDIEKDGYSALQKNYDHQLK